MLIKHWVLLNKFDSELRLTNLTGKTYFVANRRVASLCLNIILIDKIFFLNYSEFREEGRGHLTDNSSEANVEQMSQLRVLTRDRDLETRGMGQQPLG